MAPGLKRAIRDPAGFRDAVQLYGYKMPAIRVDSAEAWHYHFQWTPEIEADAARLLRAPTAKGLLETSWPSESGSANKVPSGN
jgi:hypothetical protein